MKNYNHSFASNAVRWTAILTMLVLVPGVTFLSLGVMNAKADTFDGGGDAGLNFSDGGGDAGTSFQSQEIFDGGGDAGIINDGGGDAGQTIFDGGGDAGQTIVDGGGDAGEIVVDGGGDAGETIVDGGGDAGEIDTGNEGGVVLTQTPPPIVTQVIPPPVTGCTQNCSPVTGCTQNCTPTCTQNCSPCTQNCSPCTQNCNTCTQNCSPGCTTDCIPVTGCTSNCGGGGYTPPPIFLAAVPITGAPPSFVYLNQVPYTGLGDDLLAAIYMLALALVSAAAAYAVVYRKSIEAYLEKRRIVPAAKVAQLVAQPVMVTVAPIAPQLATASQYAGKSYVFSTATMSWTMA